MPNWVYNSVVIEFGNEGENSGNLPEMFFRMVCGSHPLDPEHKGLNFLKLICPPEERWEEYLKAPSFGEGASDFGWYNWNNRNWDTKWNATDTDASSDGNTLKIFFQTAWSPPRPIFDQLSELARDCGATSFDVWWEEEQGFGGELSWNPIKNLIVTKSWEIPESHADYVAQGKEDLCPCDDWANPECWFEDCPGRAEAIAEQEAINEGVGAS